MKICNFAVCGLCLGWAAATAAADIPRTSKPVRPIPAVTHVVLISVDGLRPDLALRAKMPTLRSMLRDGAYTFWAKTTSESVTLPAHTSMVTGVTSGKHGVTWNDDLVGEPQYPKFPTVMEMATTAGYSTAMIAGKSKFSTLNKPGTITHAFVPSAANTVVSNAVVVAHAEQIIVDYRPNLLFIHLPDPDTAGHEYGWGSPEQIAAIENTDTALARIFAALERASLRSSTVVILSADHGGTGLTHGADDARSRYIPWIAVGPGVKRDYDLSRQEQLEIQTEDSAATICYLLGLPRQPYFDGKPVLAAFSSDAPAARESAYDSRPMDALRATAQRRSANRGHWSNRP